MPQPAPGVRHKPPFATPDAAEAAFYAAFAATDLGIMAGVWDDGEDTLCIHPGGGLLQGRTAVMQSWMEIFSGARPPTIEVEVVTTLVSGGMAVHVRTESIRPNGQSAEQASRVLATNIFRRRGGSWYLVVHQASLPLRVRPVRGTGDHRIH